MKKYKDFYEKRYLLKNSNKTDINNIIHIEKDYKNNYHDDKKEKNEYDNKIVDNNLEAKENNIIIKNKGVDESNNLKNGIQENKYENSFCNKKRNREKKKYFIFVKKPKK